MGAVSCLHYVYDTKVRMRADHVGAGEQPTGQVEVLEAAGPALEDCVQQREQNLLQSHLCFILRVIPRPDSTKPGEEMEMSPAGLVESPGQSWRASGADGSGAVLELASCPSFLELCRPSVFGSRHKANNLTCSQNTFLVIVILRLSLLL